MTEITGCGASRVAEHRSHSSAAKTGQGGVYFANFELEYDNCIVLCAAPLICMEKLLEGWKGDRKPLEGCTQGVFVSMFSGLFQRGNTRVRFFLVQLLRTALAKQSGAQGENPQGRGKTVFNKAGQPEIFEIKVPGSRVPRPLPWIHPGRSSKLGPPLKELAQFVSNCRNLSP